MRYKKLKALSENSGFGTSQPNSKGYWVKGVLPCMARYGKVMVRLGSGDVALKKNGE